MYCNQFTLQFSLLLRDMNYQCERCWRVSYFLSCHVIVGLPDHLKLFQGHFAFQADTVGYFDGRLQGGKTGICPALELGQRTKNF